MIDDPATEDSIRDMADALFLTPDQRIAPLKAPFPWFGGKSRVAPLIWERFGDVPNFVEPFFGSGAVLFSKPPSAIETVNDIDDDIVNFFTVLREHPEELARKIEIGRAHV